MVKVISGPEFEAEVLKCSVPVVVDFYADWCGPCNDIAPVLDELSTDFDGRAKVFKMDIDQDKETAVQYGVKRIPNMVFFKNGVVVDQVIGKVDKNELAGKLNPLL
ncbi:MAG: thioredoxin [Defluviitaleaceae bacterium]|nr:thioredoxin [Defluviitaleaceae bacterium]